MDAHWRTRFPILLALSLACGCANRPSPDPAAGDETESRAAEGGKVVPLKTLPQISLEDATRGYLQQLPEPTKLGENAVVHVRMPPPLDEGLTESLVRVVGPLDAPMVLFRSDALVELGVIPKSPGKEFFARFVYFDPAELSERIEDEAQLLDGHFGVPVEETIEYDRRIPIGVRNGPDIDIGDFFSGNPLPLGPCRARPESNAEAWGRSLLITDPAVVQDDARTFDRCRADPGTRGGVWTFAHFMEEMAQGSGLTTQEFVLDWLNAYVHPYDVNGFTVLPPPAMGAAVMFEDVVRPWAIISGVEATLVGSGADRHIEVDGALDLDAAPFRLLAIVNRVDLAGTDPDTPAYSGSTSADLVNAGELRFVFGAIAYDLSECALELPFTVIFEYGVPREGCTQATDWAQGWTELNRLPAFGPAYLDKLESLTEEVVRHGAAPTKGNQSALNQIRTNETALSPGVTPWEFREFTLTDEDPEAGTDMPSDGPLRPHTLAMTPHGSFGLHPHAEVDAFVAAAVTPLETSVPGPLPEGCGAAFTVPGWFDGAPFLGGSTAYGSGFHGFWNVDPVTTLAQQCGRHQFSLNTCNGCHFSDTATRFVHVDPIGGIPAGLSSFLTGGGDGMFFEVPDPQTGAVSWRFADLDRRFRRLYDLAFCTECDTDAIMVPSMLDTMMEISGVVPADPGARQELPYQLGPIKELGDVKSLLEARIEHTDPDNLRDVSVDHVRARQTFVH